jgi:hypothetical protein
MEESVTTAEPKADSFITVQQYAALKNVTVQAVYGKINRRTITVKKIGNFILVKDL